MSTNRHIPTTLPEVGSEHLRLNFSATCAEVHATGEPVQITRWRRATGRPACIVPTDMWETAAHEHPLLAPARTRVSDQLTTEYARSGLTGRILLPIAREGWHVPIATQDWAVVFVPTEWVDQLRELAN